MDNTTLTQHDLELLQAAEELAELAKSAGIDINALTDDQVLELAIKTGEAIAQQEAEGQSAEEEKKEENKEEKSEGSEQPKEGEFDPEFLQKVAEADFLGRTMAHAMIDELNKVAQQAMEAMSAGESEKKEEEKAEEKPEEKKEETGEGQKEAMAKVAGVSNLIDLWFAAKFGNQ